MHTPGLLILGIFTFLSFAHVDAQGFEAEQLVATAIEAHDRQESGSWDHPSLDPDAPPLSSQVDRQHGGAHGHHHAGLAFSHPLIAESPSPDTKIRLSHFYAHDNDEDEHTLGLEFEYAFAQWGSVEIDLPFTFIDFDQGPDPSHVDNIEIGLKLACRRFEEHGVLIGGGIELELPTGDDHRGIGSNNELHIEPFVDFGIKAENIEVVGFLSFGIPTNEDDDEKDEVDLEMGYNLSVLCHVTSQLQLLLELDGEAVASGHDNESILNVTPGVKIRPWAESSVTVGAGLRIPVTRDKEFDLQTIFSVFYHF